MKDVILITAYTPDDERILYLEKTINFFYKLGKDIILVTHSPNTPNNIITKCKYYLYSSENTLLDDIEYKWFVNRNVGKFIFGSKYVTNYKVTTLAIYNMIYTGSLIAKSLGYNILHYVEYDSEFITDNIIQLSNDKINEGYNSFIISDNDFDLCGGYMAIKLDSHYFDEFTYNETKLKNLCSNFVITENFTRNCFLKNKIYKISINEAKELGYNLTKYNYAKKSYPFAFPAIYNEFILFVHDNQNQIDEELIVIVNNDKIIKNLTKPFNYVYYNLGNVNDIKNITVIINETVIKKYDLSTDINKKLLYDNSFVKKIDE